MTDEAAYSFGHKPSSVDYMSIRTVERNARFALPYLTAGLKVLDCGCGPGSMTLGLAGRVMPGSVVGIDLDIAQVLQAKSHAKAAGIDNLEFREANVCELPFGDGEFDFIFSHTLLCHVVEIDKAMQELWRVLRPGGCIALRDIVGSMRILSRDNARIILGDALVNRVIGQSGGDPDRGAKLGALLHKAGFVRLRLSASYDVPLPEPATTIGRPICSNIPGSQKPASGTAGRAGLK